MRALLLIVFTISSGLAFAQPRVITFESEKNSSKEGKELEKNVVKVSIFELAAGDFPIYYERVLNDYFTAEVSAGVTFGDYYGSIFSDFSSSPFDNNVDARYGYSFSAAIRFYPIAALEDFYVSPELKFRKYNWSRDIEDYNVNYPYEPIILATFDEKRSYVMPRINLGYSFFYDNNLIFDWHFGVGMNTPTETMYDYNTKTVNTNKRNTRPRIHFGLKIGYVF